MTSTASISPQFVDTYHVNRPSDFEFPTGIGNASFGSVDDPIRVLHLINGEHFSGAERVQQLLGRRLPECGVAPHFVCLKPGKFGQYCGLERTMFEVAPMKGRMDFHVVKQIATLATIRNVEILHAHTPRSAMVANLVSRRIGKPWIYHVHSPAARDSTRAMINYLNDQVEAWSLRRAKRIVTVSESLRREMLSRGYPDRQLSTIANGVPMAEPIDAYSRRHRREWRLGMVALVRPRKGIEILLESMSQLPADGPHVSLDVIGGFESPEYELSVRSKIAKLGLENRVRLTGFTDDVPSALRELDAMVLPSLFGEGMPMVVLEALAVGVPVIATRVEGTPEVVRDGREGILAEPRDPHSLATAISRLVSDREMWSSMCDLAFARHRECFSDLQMAQGISEVYRECVGRVPRVSPTIPLRVTDTSLVATETY